VTLDYPTAPPPNFLGQCLGDVLIDLLNSGVSVHPQKSFSDFDLIRWVGRPQPHMCTSMTSTPTPSKVKVKVTELLELWKSHFSRSISSAVFAWSSKLIVGSDRRGGPWGIVLVSTTLDTFCYLTVQTSPCYVQSFWHNTGVWQTDGRTDRQMDGRNCCS